MILSVGMLTPILCRGHNWNVHEKIAYSAFQSSDGLNTFLNENLKSTNLTDYLADHTEGRSAGDWLCSGSIMEDEQYYKICGKQFALRVMNHFYDVVPVRTPGQVIGLDDASEPCYNFVGWLPGQMTNSFVWATKDIPGPEAFGTQVGTNFYNWRWARYSEFAALTNTSQTARNANMAWLLCSLGHVIHLNQDTTSPDHVRDDNHFTIHYFEDYGMNNCTNNPQWFAPPANHGWAYWQSQGFSQLLDFWDRNLYKNNSSAALIAEAVGTTNLGLAEFCNGNFLGENALYKECADSPNHVFPFPSLASTTYSNKMASHLVSGVRPVFLNNGDLVNRIYLDKKQDGIIVSNHCVLDYLGVATGVSQFGPFGLVSVPAPRIQCVSVSIHDNNVLQAYHNILIPKAVEYSAGILDYFFRGTMDVGLNLDTNVGPYTVTNLNTSGQDFFGGAFYLFGETSGIRTLIVSSNWSEYTLSNGGSMTMTFTDPPPPGTRFISVYQGTIGMANGTALDPVETNIAIAVGRPWIEKPKTYDFYQPYTNDVGSTIKANLESDDFAFTPTAGNYEVLINYAKFDDTGTIGGVSCQWSNSPSCTLLDEITNTIVLANKVTVVGNHLRVPVTATDDPVCGGQVGWWTITITWRAWPAP